MGRTFRWFGRPLEMMERWRREYGDTFTVDLSGFERPTVFTGDPVLAKKVFSDPQNGLPPGRNYVLEPIMGSRSILLQEGTEHLSRRRLMLPPFHGERMRAYEELITEIIDTQIDSWPLGEKFALHPRMQEVTLEIILQAVFGFREGARLEALRGRLREVLKETEAPWRVIIALASRRFGAGLWPHKSFVEAMSRVDDLLYEEITERREDPELDERNDILSMLLGATFEDGEPMTDKELRDQLMTLLLAGHETTATGLAWAFDLLLRHPRAMTRLQDEIDGGTDDTYMRGVIDETLRLRPVVPQVGRRIANPIEHEGKTLPAGTDVMPVIYLIHTNAKHFPDPYAFKPERFADGEVESFAWVPFGGGVHRCLGAAFAQFEMRIVLREVLSRCEVEGVTNAPQKITRRNITFSPREGTPVVLKSRTPARPLVAA